MVNVRLTVTAAILLSGSLAMAVDLKVSPAELANHGTNSSCWIRIERRIYDITNYLDEHQREQNYSLAKWCGKDATSAWQDKDGMQKPHSRKASNALRRYDIGTFAP